MRQADDGDTTIELALPDAIAEQPTVAAALENLSAALSDEGLLIDAEVSGFSFATPPVRAQGINMTGLAPIGRPGAGAPQADSYICLGWYHDDDTKTSTCTVMF